MPGSFRVHSCEEMVAELLGTSVTQMGVCSFFLLPTSAVSIIKLSVAPESKMA
jgi:hypothetical protein